MKNDLEDLEVKYKVMKKKLKREKEKDGGLEKRITIVKDIEQPKAAFYEKEASLPPFNCSYCASLY